MYLDEKTVDKVSVNKIFVDKITLVEDFKQNYAY